MNALIKLGPYGELLTVDPRYTAQLLELLPHLRRATSSGYGEARTYTVDALPPEVTFEDSSKLAPMSSREAALKEALEKKESQWVGAFTERDAQKKRADDNEALVRRLESELAQYQARLQLGDEA